MLKDISGKSQARRQGKTPAVQSDPSDRELLNFYLKLIPRERKALFAGTARTSGLVGLCQRTIECWIETGEIRAVRVGKKYQVYLPTLQQYLSNRCDL